MAAQPEFVFNALVSDTNQPLELMAYSIYKADKNEIAVNLEKAGIPKADIDVELKNFHDLVLKSPGILKNYHTRAHALGEGLVDAIKESIKTEAKADFIERVEQLVKTEKSWYHHLGVWVMDAIKGVASSVIVIVFIGGIYSLTLSHEEKAILYSATGQAVIDTFNGEIPVIDKYREEKAKREQQLKLKKEQESNAQQQ